MRRCEQGVIKANEIVKSATVWFETFVSMLRVNAFATICFHSVHHSQTRLLRLPLSRSRASHLLRFALRAGGGGGGGGIIRIQLYYRGAQGACG